MDLDKMLIEHTALKKDLLERHHQDFPSNEAPAWARELLRKVDLILNKESNIMALADDLNNAVTSLTTAFGVLSTACTAEISALNNALAGIAVTPAVTQAISNLSVLTSSAAASAAALTASLPGATTVPPPPTPPAPSVPPTVSPIDVAVPPVTAPAATPPSVPPASATTVMGKKK